MAQAAKTERELRLERILKELVKLRNWKKALSLNEEVYVRKDIWVSKANSQKYTRNKNKLWKEAEEVVNE